jgi:signal transduction histidine kinase
MIIYRYKQKQNDYFKTIEEIKAIHDNTLLQSEKEMQEETFENISREIHDNIGQKLTLGKLQLNTLHYDSLEQVRSRVTNVVSIIGNAIDDLSDLSRSLNREMILENGFMKGLEFELAQINKSGQYSINFQLSGETVFLNEDTELVLFRLTQEVLHNIIKHAQANKIQVNLHFDSTHVTLKIKDNGKGFNMQDSRGLGRGIKNMEKRAKLLKGSCLVESNVNHGTHITFSIPLV